jgi:hypothetical protein
MLWEESIGVEAGLSKYIIREAIPKEHRDNLSEAEEAAVVWTVK